MNKKVCLSLIAAAALILMFAITACGSFEAGVPEGFVGQWKCEKLATDGETDTSFYEMRIEDDGSFSIYDAAAGNPGISGQMGNDTGTLIECVFDEDDFDAPYCWELDSEKDTLDYELADDTLKLGHNGVWMVFHRIEDEEGNQPVPEYLDYLISYELPDGFSPEMEYPYNGEPGAPIVQKAYASEKKGYFSAGILSYNGYDCMNDVTRRVDLDECVDQLDNAKEISVDGKTCYMGTIESDDMPDMAAVAYLPKDEYVFEFRLTNADEQVTDEQMKVFEEILQSVKVK